LILGTYVTRAASVIASAGLIHWASTAHLVLSKTARTGSFPVENKGPSGPFSFSLNLY